MKDKFLSSLGLCRRAGALSIGAEAVHAAIRSGKTALVFVASDVSEATMKKLATSTAYYKVELRRTEYTMAALSDALGVKHNVAAVALKQSTFVNLF
ncbi:MAG: ribosomal L7Ae/L30e/S12e/Gadd45 family protein [Clostridia bacterium]|nr:ribosomal L7Ae/L30e/S12e/Gadd45 family protein [Clostridia bacterium]